MKDYRLKWLVAAALMAAPQVQYAVLSVDRSGNTGEPRITVYGSGGGQTPLQIESIERTRKEAPKEVAWLGVFTEEVSEPLGYQLSLKMGEGLLVTYVAPESPAAKAGLQKYDVLVELGDQLLVHPYQLAKLIRGQKEGDVVKFSLIRKSKKEVASATLGQRVEESSSWPELNSTLEQKTRLEENIRRSVQPMKAMHETVVLSDANRQKYQIEVERSVEQARKALQEALQNKSQAVVTLGRNAKELEALVQSGVQLGSGVTVILKKDGSSAKSIVKADETGTRILVANPRKHLTVHDKDGKLVFDGEIETEEQQKKVPAEVWEKVKPMLEQLGPASPKPHAETTDDQNG